MKDFADVFACYPDAKEIFVVGNMPFVNEQHAANYAASSGQKVETIARPGSKKGKAEAPEAETPEAQEPKAEEPKSKKGK